MDQIWCYYSQYFPSYSFGKKDGTRNFVRSAAILKVLVQPNWFSNSSEPWVKEGRHANFGPIQAIFFKLSWPQHRHKLVHSCHGIGQRSNGANRNKQFSWSFCQGISNLVTPSLATVIPKRNLPKKETKKQRESSQKHQSETQKHQNKTDYLLIWNKPV